MGSRIGLVELNFKNRLGSAAINIGYRNRSASHTLGSRSVRQAVSGRLFVVTLGLSQLR